MKTMRCQCYEGTRGRLTGRVRPVPVAGPGQVLLRVHACGVCRTDLHLVDGELPDPLLPVVPGHEIVGTVVERGPGATRFEPGERLGVPWLGWACGDCAACARGHENLCPQARFTGYQVDGGYADYVLADERFCLRLPQRYDDLHVAPLLCAGLIGYRALRAAGDPRRLGLYGFGAAAHIVAQLAVAEGREVHAFTRPGDSAAQALALKLGAHWAGASGEAPPQPLDAAILFAPAGELVPEALARVVPGGTVVCGGIHMSDIPSFPYRLLWGERSVKSIANLTRRDGEEFMALAERVPIATEVAGLPFAQAQQALDRLRSGAVVGALVLSDMLTG